MVQPITTEHGEYKFVRIYKGQTARDPMTKVQIGVNGGIGELDSGAWVWYPQCQPVTDPQAAVRLLASVNSEGVIRFQRWWEAEQTRLDEEAMAPVVRPIKIVACEEVPGSKLVYDDGSEEDVADAGMVTAFYKEPGALQDFALTIFGARVKQMKADAFQEENETPRAAMQRQIQATQQQAKKPGRPTQTGKGAKHYSKAELHRRIQHAAALATAEEEQ